MTLEQMQKRIWARIYTLNRVIEMMERMHAIRESDMPGTGGPALAMLKSVRSRRSRLLHEAFGLRKEVRS